ncbi:MAG: hypothetical protein HGN29_00825 [Asgard group archaeon]|nr:hypothetical protein [Asgard group archaeon]
MSKKTIKQISIILSVFLLIFSPLSALAAKSSLPIQYEEGLEVVLTAKVRSKFVSEDFNITLTLAFTNKPDNVVKLFNIEIIVRLIDVHSQELTRKTVAFNSLYLNSEQSKTTTVPYDSSWGDVGLQLKVLLIADRSGSFSSLHLETHWLDFFILKTGSFVVNYFWIFIIIGLVVIFGGALTLKFTVFRK